MKQRIKSLSEYEIEQRDNNLSEFAKIKYDEGFGKLIGLPMNIWLDEDRMYVSGGHGKRSKFQKDRKKSMANISDLISISLSDYKVYKGSGKGKEIDLDKKLPKDFDVSKEDITKVIEFMQKYKLAIELLADKEINFDPQFKDIIINDKVIKKYDGKPMMGEIYQYTDKIQIKIISVSDAKVIAQELTENGGKIAFTYRREIDKYIKDGTQSSDLGKLVSGGDYVLTKSKEYAICSK